MIPLVDIPARYAWDPVEAVRELGKYLPEGARMNLRTAPGADGGTVVIAEILGLGRTWAVGSLYPNEARLSTQLYDAFKRHAAEYLVDQACRLVDQALGLGAFDAHDKRKQATSIADALKEARATPALKERTEGSREDAFVSRVLARKQRDS